MVALLRTPAQGGHESGRLATQVELVAGKRGTAEGRASVDETTAILALLLSPGVGFVSVQSALAASRSARTSLPALLTAPVRRRVSLLPPGAERAADALARCTAHHMARAAKLLERARKAGIEAHTPESRAYPAPLIRFLGSSAPPLLFTLGRAALLAEDCAAVVGARRVSPRGKTFAAACAGAFSAEGIPVVSGGARGVDTVAQDTAIARHGNLVVALPQGLLTYRPSRSVAKAVGQGAAVLVSEFPPDAPWETHAAVTRNAVISALARLVCVIEPRKTGGSIRTARIALNQGKSVLVHVGWAAAARLDGLFAAGAMPLVPKGATFNAQRLLTVWRDAAALTNHRVDLFEPRA